MDETPNTNSQQFFARVAATTAAIVLVLYLVKIWYVEPLRHPVEETPYASVQDKSPASLTGENIISWKDAANYYGKYMTVEGKIVVTHNSGKACFLNFHPDYKRYFTAVIFASAFGQFPQSPENFYMGKQVRVSGVIKEYNGKPEIVLNNPGQIVVVE